MFLKVAWEQRKVSELFKVARGYVLTATLTEPARTDETPYPVYSSQTKDKGLMGYYKDYLYEDAITWTTDGANAGTVNYRTGKFYCTNVYFTHTFTAFLYLLCHLRKTFFSAYPSILGMIYVNTDESCLQAKEIPPNSKKQSRRVIRV